MKKVILLLVACLLNGILLAIPSLQYTITASANPAEGGVVEGAGVFDENATCTLTATANEGYVFTNWTENGQLISTVASYSFTVTGDKDLVANFEPTENHWTQVPAGWYSNATTIISVILINGEEQYSDQLELGVFCGDECRGTSRPEEFYLTNRFLANVNVYGENNDELTFRLYDHRIGMELDLTPPESVVFTDDGYGTPTMPYELDFVGEISNVTPNPMDFGMRPSNAWMRPHTFQIYNAGNFSVINSITTDNPYFLVEELDVPFTIGLNETRELSVTTGEGEGEELGHLIINYRDNETIQYDLTAVAYDPAVKDVWETAYEVTSFPFTDSIVVADIPLYNNYYLPPTSVEDGPDAVYKLVFDQDVLLNASLTSGENGKMALYPEGFMGIGGPDTENNHTGEVTRGNNRDIVEIGTGTSTTYVTPYNSLWGYSFVEQVYTADEIGTAGTITAISFNMQSTSAQSNMVDVFMKNVSRTEFSSSTDYETVTASDMVFSGTVTFSPGWTTITLDTPFQFDGTSNLMIGMHEYTSGYSTRYFYYTTATNKVITFHSDSYNPDPYNLGSYSGNKYISSNRANIQLNITSSNAIGIRNMTVPQGTYYLATSSTSEAWGIEINTDTLDCPVMTSNPTPANNNTVSPTAVQLQWTLGNRTTEYMLKFGSHPDSLNTLVDWTRDLAQSYLVTNLSNNTTYYWQVIERNDGCPDGVEGPVWAFSTLLDAPFVYYSSAQLFNDETLSLSWDLIADTCILAYNIYQDNVLIGYTTGDSYTVGPLPYNMQGYQFYLTAQYAGGESNPSNTFNIYVSGYGDVNGHVYEQDGTTGIAGATVTMVGVDEFNVSHTYNFQTNSQGYYSGHIYAGTYNGSASCNGYQPVNEPVQGNPIELAYNETISPIDYILDENFDPVCSVFAEYYPDAENPNSPYVKIYEGGITEFLYDFDDSSMQGWTTINTDGDGYDWCIASSLTNSGSISGHNGSTDCVLSQSWYGGTIIYPDNYLVSPQVQLGGSISFWACAQDANYAAEYFGVAVSTTSNTDPAAFTMLDEWTMTAKGVGAPTNYTRSGNRSQGNWYLYTVDLSAYSGMGYVAIRHFNCSDWYMLVVDDIVINTSNRSVPNRAFSHYRYYRTDAYNNGPYTVENTVLLADNVTDTVLIDATWEDAEPGVYKFGISRVYEGNRDSETAQLTVHDGTSTNSYVPVYGFYVDAYNKTEIVYPASELSVLNGTDINSLKFYASDAAVSWGSANFQVFMAEVDEVSISSFYGPGTIVYEGSLSIVDNEMEVNFDTPYRYNGGNLLIGVYNNVSGSYVACTWVGESVEGASIHGYNYSGLSSVTPTQRNFLPKTTFNYTVVVPPIQGPRESEIVWSNPLEKNMYLTDGDVNITVALNSGDSPEGTVVSFTNLNANEQALYPIDDVVLDATGYYAWDSFRCGDYLLLISFDGYATIAEEVSIWEPADLSYMLEEIAYTISNLYVSSTGWAMWNDDLNGNELPLLDSGRHFEQYQVVFTDTEDVAIYEDIITNHYLQLPVENLVEGGTYRLKVASEYSSGLSQWYVVDWTYQSCSNNEGFSNLTAEFNDESNTLSWSYPEAEGVSYDVQIGDGTNTVSNAPINDYYGYSLTQQLYRASELEGMGAVAGPISSIGWSRYNPYDYHFTHHIKIWMANVTDNAVSSNSLDVNTMTLVYDDEYTIIRDWNMFNIASFAWDGVSNLLIVVATDAIGVFNSNQASWWRVTQTDYISSRSLYSSNTPFYPETQTYSFNNYSYNRPNLRIVAKQKAPMGAMVYREGEFLGFSQESSYTDTQFTGNHEYEIRVVYDGSAGLPNNNVYYSMSCPQLIGGATYEVTVAADPEECGIVTGGGSFINGSSCTVTATTNPGYQFTNWTINGEVVSNVPTYTFFVHEDAACVAHFNNSQSIPLAAGWNWMNSFIELNGMDALSMLEEGMGEYGIQIQSQDAYVVNYNGFWMGELESLTNEQTYLVQTLADTSMTFYGPVAQTSDHPITMSTGWNWIGYPVNTEMSVDEAFTNFMPADGDEVKAQSDYAVYYSGYGWIGDLNTIMPGMGLMYHAANSGTFTYPDSTRGDELAKNGTKDGEHWTSDIHAYPTNMTMMAVVELDGEELQRENYELAAFADGEVRGSAKLMYVQPIDRYVAFLTIAGNDPVELHFGLYNEVTGEETFDSDDHLTYTINTIVGNPNELAVVHFRGTTGLDDIERNLHVYPNPVARGERICLNLPVSSEVSVETVNALGVVVNVEPSTKAPATIKAPETSGIYTLRITVEGKGTYTRKLVVR